MDNWRAAAIGKAVDYYFILNFLLSATMNEFWISLFGEDMDKNMRLLFDTMECRMLPVRNMHAIWLTYEIGLRAVNEIAMQWRILE